MPCSNAAAGYDRGMSEVGIDGLKTVAEAIAVLDVVGVSPRTEQVGLLDADGRVLAADIAADRDYPPFDKSLMDGYALRAADAMAPGTPLRCVGEVAAGASLSRPLASGECVAIMTGAPLPAGADAVVPIERTTRSGDAVTLSAAIKIGSAVASRGVESKIGRVLLTRGVRLEPAQLAVCAQVGAAVVSVFARPQVGILSSGDEVIPFDQQPTGAQVRGSNSILLAALARRYGSEVIDLGHVRDDPAAIAEKLRTPDLDALLVTGGMSMGAYDFTPRVLRDLGYDLAVTKLKVKPGKPFVFATRDPDSPLTPFVFGLPGNPVSAFVCTVRLASRVLLRLGGASPEPTWATATLADNLPANGPREFYLPATVTAGVANAPAWGGSADVFGLASANALIVRAANEAALPKGMSVAAILLP